MSQNPKSQLSEPLAHLVDGLKEVAGLTLEPGRPLAPLTTLRVGGPAELFVDVATEDALCELVRAVRNASVSFHLLGLGSNVMVPDEGLDGVVVRLVGEFKESDLDEATHTVVAGAGVPLPLLANRMAKQGQVGMEALSGFPSTVGGAVFMNAGCYGTEIKDLLVEARVIDEQGEARVLQVEELGASYRRTRLQGTEILVTQATFQLASGDAVAAVAKIKELNSRRWKSLPSGKPTAGSIFRNPEGDYAGRVIEAVGLKGFQIGQAAISEKHANVIVNLGDATADQMVSLMEEALTRVYGEFGLELEPEVVLAGSLKKRFDAFQEQLAG